MKSVMPDIPPRKPPEPTTPRPKAPIAEGHEPASPPSRAQLTQQHTPVTRQPPSNTILAGLLSLLLRWGNAISSVGATISGLFIRAQRTDQNTPPTTRPVTKDEAYAAILEQQKKTTRYAQSFSDEFSDSGQKLEAQFNKYLNESELPGVRSSSLGIPKYNKESMRDLAAAYFDSHTADPGQPLPDTPIKYNLDSFAGTVSLDYDPLTRLVLVLDLDQIATISTKSSRDRPQLVARELEKVNDAIHRLDSNLSIELSDTNPTTKALFRSELADYRHALLEFEIANLRLTLEELESINETYPGSIGQSRLAIQESLKKYLVVIEEQFEIERIQSDIIKLERDRSFFSSTGDPATLDDYSELQQKQLTADVVASATEPTGEENSWKNFDSTKEKLDQSYEKLEQLRQTYIPYIRKLSEVESDIFSAEDPKVSPRSDSESGTKLVPSAIPDQTATPMKSILKQETTVVASKSGKKVVSFNLHVEERSKPELVNHPVSGEIERHTGTFRNISILRSTSRDTKGGYQGRLDQKMGLFLFLESNGLITSDTVLPTDDPGAGLDWDALTQTAMRLKTAEQQPSKQNQDVDNPQAASELTELARPDGNQQFIYWKPEKISLREWALIGLGWAYFDYPGDRIGPIAAKLKESNPALFKDWDPQISFKRWYGEVNS